MKFGVWIVIVVAVVVLRIARQRRKKADATPARRGPSAVRLRFEALFGDIGLVAARELRERTRGRIYRVGTLLMLAIVAAAIVIPTIKSGGSSTTDVGTVGTPSPALRSAISSAASANQIDARVVTEASTAAGMRDLRSGRLDLLVAGGRILVLQALTASDSSDTATLAEALSPKLETDATIAAADLSPAQLSVLAHPVRVPIVGLTAAPKKKAVTVSGSSIIGLVLLFVLLSQYSVWVLMGVAEEKSSRVVEVLLGTLRSIHLLAGKVLGIGAAALAQASAIVVFALLLTHAVGSHILQGTAVLQLASSLLWLVLGYAFYCWVYAAAGSLAERQDQLQSLTFPLTIPMLIGYIVSITAATSGNASLFFKVLAYLPPTAPFAMPVLVGLGGATWWEFVLSVVLSIAATIGVARLAAGIYQRAILRTGRRVKLREVLHANR